MAKYIGPLTWAWLIIVGGLMFIPGNPPDCIVCGNLAQLFGIISIVLGIAGFALNRGGMAMKG